jgi:hypothetical protein
VGAHFSLDNEQKEEKKNETDVSDPFGDGRKPQRNMVHVRKRKKQNQK